MEQNARTKKKMQGQHRKRFLGSLRASRAIKNVLGGIEDKKKFFWNFLTFNSSKLNQRIAFERWRRLFVPWLHLSFFILWLRAYCGETQCQFLSNSWYFLTIHMYCKSFQIKNSNRRQVMLCWFLILIGAWELVLQSQWVHFGSQKFHVLCQKSPVESRYPELMYKRYCLYPPGHLVQCHLCFIEGISLPLEARKELLAERNLLRFHYTRLNGSY